MTPAMITNPNVYTVPDIDSDSDSEDYTRPSNRGKHYKSEEQEKNLIKLGCYYNPLEEYKRSYLLQNPKCFDQQYDIKLKQHQLKVEKERKMFLEKLQKKKEEEKKKYDVFISNLSNLTLDEKKLDKEFQEELAKQRKSVEEAIAYDRKRTETETAEAKSKAEKEQKESEQKELKKKENEKIKKMKDSAATSLSGLEQFQKYYAKIEYYKTNIKSKLNDAAFRKAWFSKKSGIKRTISQLTSDHSFVFLKYQDIYALLMSIKQESNDAFEITLNYLAKEILRQVAVDVSNKKYCAYIYSRFAYMFCSSIPEFTDYLLGRLYKRCPYIVPRFYDDDPTLSDAEMRAKLRYTYSDKQGKVKETYLLHAERNRGFIMFYAGLCQTIPDPGHPQNPFSIKDAWIYLARLLNMSLRPITPFLITGVLEIAGKSLLENYPNQMPKIFRLLRDKVLPLIKAERHTDSIAATDQLENFLNTYFSKGIADVISEIPPQSENIGKKPY